jgi:glyoxylase I family protein
MPNIEHFAIYGADPHALKAFYEDVLGMHTVLANPNGDPAGYFLADDRGGVIEIIGRPAGAEAVNQRFVCHIAFVIPPDEYDATLGRLKALGLPFEVETEVDTPRMRTAFFQDPGGNRVQIVWRKSALA